MNNEQQELVDRAYNKFLTYLHDNQIFINSWDMDSFVRDCKKDSEYGKMWGLTVEERELSLEERNDVYKKQWESGASELSHDRFNSLNIPTKLITVTRELSLDERVKIFGVEKINTTDTGYYEHSYAQFKVDEANIPTTKTIESYE